MQGGDAFAGAGRASYIFNGAGIDQADALLIIGANPRKEEPPVLNARIRKRWRVRPVKIGVIGAKADLTYHYDYLGAGTDSLGELAGGKGSFLDALKNASHPIVLVGAGAVARQDGVARAVARREARGRYRRHQGRLELLCGCTTPPRASARSISALPPGRRPRR